MISSFISSNLKIKRLASDDRAAAVARLSMQHPAAVKALSMEDAVAAHYGPYYDSFVASFSPFKNSVCRILVPTSFQVPSATKFSKHKSCNTFHPSQLSIAVCTYVGCQLVAALHVPPLPCPSLPLQLQPPVPPPPPPALVT